MKHPNARHRELAVVRLLMQQFILRLSAEELEGIADSDKTIRLSVKARLVRLAR